MNRITFWSVSLYCSANTTTLSNFKPEHKPKWIFYKTKSLLWNCYKGGNYPATRQLQITAPHMCVVLCWILMWENIHSGWGFFLNRISFVFYALVFAVASAWGGGDVGVRESRARHERPAESCSVRRIQQDRRHRTVRPQHFLFTNTSYLLCRKSTHTSHSLLGQWTSAHFLFLGWPHCKFSMHKLHNVMRSAHPLKCYCCSTPLTFIVAPDHKVELQPFFVPPQLWLFVAIRWK